MRAATILLSGLLMLLSGCQTPPPSGDRVTADAFPEGVYERAAAAGRAVYDLDPEASRIRLYAYRSGTLAEYGHNHVIAARDWRGAAIVDPDDLDASRLDLRLPVSGLDVDPPAVREPLGGGFASTLDAADRADTETNLRSPSLLDAEAHPRIGVTLSAVEGALPRPLLTLVIRAGGGQATVRVPVAVTLDDGRVTATGRFVLTHSALGLTPFSAAGGALRVAEPVTVEFRLVGRRRSGG